MSQLQGIEQFRKQLEALDKKVRNRLIKTALRDGAKVMAAAVRSRARVKSGKLRKSVKVRAGRRKKDVLSVRVVITGGHDSPMVAAEEYGTATQAPHSFIRPGFEASKDQALAGMIADIKSGLEHPG